MRTTDLNEPSAPDEIPDVLREAAQRMLERALELRYTHQDPAAGKPWLMIERELERCAKRIEKRL